MMSLKRHIVLFVFILISVYSIAQPSWHYSNTGSNHTILIQDTIEISIDGVQISSGDYIGVFYDSLGTEACAGYKQWQGLATTIAVWGSQSGQNDGFANGEEISWRIWRAVDQLEFEAIATYDTIMFPNQGNFSPNGLSRLASLTVLTTGTNGPPWNYTITPNTHKIIFPDTLEIAPNFNMNIGDYIGVFYDGGGILKCGGYFEWTGITDTLVAYGDSPGQNNGFVLGEYLSFKLWRTDSNEEYYISHESIIFDTQYPDSLIYNNNGLTFISKIGQFTGDDLQINDVVFPQSGCELSYQNVFPIIEITNVGDSIISEISGSIYFTGTYGDFFTITNLNILPDSNSTIEIPYPVDINGLGDYDISIQAHSQNDINTTNSLIHQTITNSLFHSVNILTPDSVVCSNNQSSIILEAFPLGGSFLGQSLIGNEFFPVQSGVFPIIYKQNNSETGCSNYDTITITVLDSPPLDFGNDIVACDGDTIILEAISGLYDYNWAGSTNTTNILEVTSSGVFSLTVTDFLNCKSSDEIEIIFNPIPVVSISGYSSACDGETITLDAGSGFDFYQWQDSGSVFSQTLEVTETGTYYITVTEDNCYGSDDFYVNFYPLPEVEITSEGLACEGKTVKLQASGGYQFYFWSSSIGNASSISITQSGEYSVSVLSPDNCIGSDTIEITFNPYPEIHFNNPPTLCSGDTFILNPGEADYYLWQDSSSLSYFPVTDDGNYFVSLTSDGCTSSEETSIIFFDKPEASFSYLKDFNSVQFINNSEIADNYYWDFGDGSVSSVYEPEYIFDSEGIYEISLAAVNSCGGNSFKDTIEIFNISGTAEFKFPLIYPNPGVGYFTIDFPVYERSSFLLTIIDSEGKEIITNREFTFERGEYLFDLDLTFAEQGIYYAIWKFKSETFTNTLMIINPSKE